MAHFAEIDDNNIVLRILVVDNEHQDRGSDYLSIDCALGGRWVQTSYNTIGGIHLSSGTPFRKNFAGVGMIFDEARDAFYVPQPYPSWVLNEDTCEWEAPLPLPTPHPECYSWEEDTQEWLLRVPIPVDDSYTKSNTIKKVQIAE
jgi:hypothetical protein